MRDRRGKIRVLSLLLFFWSLLFSLPLTAFEWPLAEQRLLMSFGQNKWGGFLKAVALQGESGEIYPVEEGEILFVRRESGLPDKHGLGAGLGTMVVMQHQRGIRSLYGNIDSLQNPGKLNFRREDVLALMKPESDSTEGYLYLQIIDSEVDRYINPLLSLPSLDDRRAPVIRSVFLVDESGRTYSPETGSVLNQGSYKLLIETYDPSSATENGTAMAPFSIKVYLNGVEMHGLSFESIVIKEGQSLVIGAREYAYQNLYRGLDEYSFEPLVLRNGEAELELVVSDFSGNETVEVYQLQVRR
ncbi:MAG TPA: hypothetical protein ENN41_08390 [Sediminispirochaeta sp.]|nr:hypothetical protein [Sediminispirochaeta sp.]